MIPSPPRALIDRYAVNGPRYTSYPAATEWTPSFTLAHLAGRLATADALDAPLSLYVHLPFCEQMCHFCGCNVIATRDRSRADDYLDGLEREAALWAARLPRRRSLGQVHLGGGTPTFLSARQLARLWEIVTRHFTPLPDAELAVEVDPAVTTRAQLSLLGGLGFNRLSVGVQDLDLEVQKAVGRLQSEEDTREVVEGARAYGFSSINVDLMYGLPHQRPDELASTVERILAMHPDRVALFGYAHVPWMKPNQRLLPQAALPGTHERVELFVTAARRLEARGYSQIGLDHFARPGDELAEAQARGTLSRNFQGYTVRAAPDTIALGVSAISDVAGAFVQGPHRLPDWRASVDAGRLPVERGLVRSEDDELRGAAIAALMCLLRLELAPLRARFGDAVEKLRPGLDALAPLEDDGLVRRRDDGLDVTPLGRLFLRNIAMAFDGYLARHDSGARAFSRTL